MQASPPDERCVLLECGRSPVSAGCDAVRASRRAWLAKHHTLSHGHILSIVGSSVVTSCLYFSASLGAIGSFTVICSAKGSAAWTLALPSPWDAAQSCRDGAPSQ